MAGSVRPRSNRGSSRSRGSSTYSYERDTRERIKDCLRKFVAFMCTQVGVGAMLVCYAFIGAVSFMHIEGTAKGETDEVEVVRGLRTVALHNLFEVAYNNNILERDRFFQQSDEELRRYQGQLVEIFRHGYDLKPEDMWTFPASLMFSLSIITMIGYGNMVPKTVSGKVATMIYAIFGIPLYVLYFLNMGEVMAGCFRWGYRWLYKCSTETDPTEPPKRIIVPSTACLWVIGAYVLTGAIMFTAWEKWSYLDSTYFCVTSLCKLGLGDLVPGTDINSFEGNQTKLLITFCYMLLGLGLVAMCYNLMREDIKVKMQEMREDFSQCLEDTRLKFIKCYRRRRVDEEYSY
ncbi:TWiK family of potassium channels protein 18 isoform X1 [Aethina tumida]|uniref:TWiK family of potassium channels protein 18 isoform X1 n=1 Tax=Aethina tumida TaxID=116153 RepID=UPI00096B074C|nr:TWiK family of potassium channels protein 18 isoform X1 [Aethina tumida]